MALSMMVINGIIMYIISNVMGNTMIATEYKYLTEITKNISNTTQQTVMEYVAICDVLAKNYAIIEVLRDSDQSHPMVEHPSASIVVEEMLRITESYDGKIMSMAIFDVEQDSMLLNTGAVSEEDFSFRTRPYYEPVLTREYVITPPYLDILTNGLVVTIACPVIDDDVVLGVVGLDVPIDFISLLVIDSSYGDSGRSLVIDESNTILAYADPSYINSNYSALNLIGENLDRELENPTGELVSYIMNGERRLGMVTEIDEFEWKVLTGMDYSEFDQISAIINLLLGISMVVTLAICGFLITGRMSKELDHLNQKDTLTGLLNRAGFTNQIDEILKMEPKMLGIISVNINGLKYINENSGISAGDKHIMAAIVRLKEHFNYEFFRMSGDELVGIACNVESGEFEEKVDELHKRMHKSNNYDFSFGHAWGSGSYDIWKLMQEADAMMYINKQEYYATSKRQFDQVDNTVLSDLLSYLANDEFMVYLQPQVKLKDGSLYGAEALIRRYDKTNEKMVFPDQFVPLYEQKSVIRHVDIFVIETVCQLLDKLNQAGEAIPISVNLSRVTLLEYGIVDTIVKICDQYHVPHELLVIEVTERVGLIENNVPSVLVKNFKDNGFLISLDDFGCAYSNIVTLSQIEVDEVKIDKSLVDDLITNKKNQILVKNVLSMCNELEGSSTLAEGIEEEGQAKLLYELGCHLGQGYLYSRPIPIEEFIKGYIH